MFSIPLPNIKGVLDILYKQIITKGEATRTCIKCAAVLSRETIWKSTHDILLLYVFLSKGQRSPLQCETLYPHLTLLIFHQLLSSLICHSGKNAKKGLY
jgi:hypothetical protein